ncbi:SurE domain-containing protein [Heracleum sosnowskyi]|uniref:SurE domain-containing protein n=1 Tax=Heracleum sosnowskyi TaxID=360622 RepID=A0AAD8GXT1_9APIA|nr:SurE domain-containing protein [Heracleum sosnowskyi]
MDSNWFQGLNFSLYSGTVAGAREAFFEGVPAISISYDWIGGKSTVKDFKLAAEACLPIINAILADVRNKKYPQKCFLNIDLPTDVLNQKACNGNQYEVLRLSTQLNAVDHQISLMVGIELVTNKKDKTPTKAKTAVLFEKLRGMVGMDLLKMMVVGQTICRPQLK